jgi:hypothetical protein
MDGIMNTELEYPFLLIAAYLLPFVVAVSRRHRQRLAIFCLNLLLGWTLLGWIAALVWACTSDVEAKREPKSKTIVGAARMDLPPSPMLRNWR